MSNYGKFQDRTPFIRNAGSTTAIQALSVDNSIRQGVYFQPGQTPERIKKYRKSEKEIIGRKQLHHGVYDDNKDYEEYIHGIKTKGSDHVSDCIKGSNQNGIGYFLNKIQEQKYSSFKRETLGNSIQRNYIFTDSLTQSDFKFGVLTTGCKIKYIIII